MPNLQGVSMKNPQPSAKRTDPRPSRRRFLGGCAALSAAAVVPRYVLGGAGFTAPSEILNLAVIGTGGRGKQLASEMMRHPDARVIAIADPNERADYERFYYKKTAGRLVVHEMIEAGYAQKKAKGEYAGCKEYADYRRMLEKEKSIDAVVVATPDHVHAAATLAAIGLGKHVYCEKPLTRTVEEARRVAKEARRAGVATQMGNQGNSSEGMRSACEWIWAGAIGEVTEVHAWSDTGGWANEYTARPVETPPVPRGLDWDLWLGPARKRPYHPAYAPYNWRGWWEFGTGAIGDMGCHNIDPAFVALKLGAPATVEASSTPINGETVPRAALIHYTFPAREGLPPVKLTWYDCGLYPPRPEELEPGEKLDRNGSLFIGTKGKMLMGGWSRDPRLLPAKRMQEFTPPPKTLRRVEAHDRAWLDACKGGPPASSSFDHGGPLTELVLLGNVALRTGEKLHWDAKALKATNCAEADGYLRASYREGWGV
jgi:predicted dehydrogenase